MSLGLRIGSYLGAAICRAHVGVWQSIARVAAGAFAFETYLVHSLASAPNADKNSSRSWSFSAISWTPSINATYSGPSVFSSVQSNDRFAVFLLVGLRHLLSEFLYIAIGLCFDFVAADDCHDLLRVTLAHLGRAWALSLCEQRYGCDQQNSNN